MLNRRHRRPTFLVCLLLVLAFVAAACGGDDGGTGGGTGEATGPKDETTPKPGGKVVYGLEAESTQGYCLSSGQLAAAGITVATAFYDTLTVPNDKGEVVPYLAKSVTPNANFTEWTITVRDNVKFHDGTDLNAEAVKLNLDTYRKGTLFGIILQNIADTQVVDPTSVKVITKVPWVAFPSALFSTGRLGIMAPAQINDTANCPRNLIGTGPFKLKELVVNDHTTGTKNPNYWQPGLPYLDEIEFKPVVDEGQRLNALKAGQLNLLHTTSGPQIVALRNEAKAGNAKVLENEKSTEISYDLLNTKKPPFDRLECRQAVQLSYGPAERINIIQQGVNTPAVQPFAPDVKGYAENVPWPKQDLTRARQLAQQCAQAQGGEFRFTIGHTPTPSTTQEAQLAKTQFEKVGIKIDLKAVEQSQFINEALGGNFQYSLWRNHPGGDPDTQYYWWTTGSPVNFNGFSDPELDRIFIEGRSEPDPAKRKALYDGVSAEFAKEAYNLWKWYSLWTFASRPEVNGVAGPDLPEGGKPGIVVNRHPVVGLWISK